jgi:hypothetical protein
MYMLTFTVSVVVVVVAVRSLFSSTNSTHVVNYHTFSFILFHLQKNKNVEGSSPSSSGIDVDEFCPRMDETNMKILQQIAEHADDTALYSASNTTVENESGSDSENELLPKDTILPEPDELDALGDELDDPILNEMVLTQSAEYKRKHFSNVSSDSSDTDDSITRGLDFKNIPVTATIEPHTSPSLLKNIQHTIARNLLDNIMRTDKPNASSQKKFTNDSDEDSDFEILDSEEIPK